MSGYTLGISCYYHDSAAALLYNGEILGAIQEERLSRIKNDEGFPELAIHALLKQHGVSVDDIKQVAYYEKPFLTFERLLETYHAFYPRGFFSFLKVMPIWIKEKLFIKKDLFERLEIIGLKDFKIIFPEHHLSHMASCFYPSPFEEAAILTTDGVGEWNTLSMAHGKGRHITSLRKIDFPHSLGLFYSSFTYFCGFKVNSGEYKLMGLAPYGNKYSELTEHYVLLIKEKLITIYDDGSFHLNMDYFTFATTFKMIPEKKWEKLFGIPTRKDDAPLSKEVFALALACQKVTEEIILKLAKTLKSITGCDSLCLAGGVALNCVANGLLAKSGVFKNIWVQPASGDAGGALGAALCYEYIQNKNERAIILPDAMKGAALGPSFSDDEILVIINKHLAEIQFKKLDEEELLKKAAQSIFEGKVIGWFQGRLEFGPRALGNRSILANPMNEDMQKKVNLKIKFREGFRPFAPAVLEEDFDKYFDGPYTSSYMQFVYKLKANWKSDKQNPNSKNNTLSNDPIKSQLEEIDSIFPAITHVDGSARVQSVAKEQNLLFYKLLELHKDLCGHGILLNTSFNIRGEPIVCHPEEAIQCFLKTEMDELFLGGFWITKRLK